MDFADQINQLVAQIPKHLDHIQTEEATKNALILPMLNSLGYNVFNPTEVVPEFTADVGTKKGEKVDYAIMKDGQPIILIECKTAGAKLSLNHASQLFRYFAVTPARFAILTNGIEYQFYTDIEAPNRMDEKPFLEFSLLSADQRTIDELKKFTKSSFDVDNILSNASELKYKKQILAILVKELDAPSEEFVRLFAQRVYGGRLAPSVKEQFTPLVRDAFREFIRSSVNERIQFALDKPAPVSPQVEVDPPSADQEGDLIVTTDEEIEAFNIVRAILAKVVDPTRVVMRDVRNYCGILLDDNNRKPICRLHFNRARKFVGLFDAQKNEERVEIERPLDLFKFDQRLHEIIRIYDGNPDSKDETK
jgi:hypothetical protein